MYFHDLGFFCLYWKILILGLGNIKDGGWGYFNFQVFSLIIFFFFYFFIKVMEDDIIKFVNF
jgi:hypothetical protein